MSALSPDPVYIMKGDMGPIHGLLFHVTPYVEHLYAGTESGKIHIWDMRRNRELVKLNNSNDPCLAMQIFGDDLLVTQRKGGAINFWQANKSTWNINNTVKFDYFGFCKIQSASKNLLFIPLNDSKVGIFSLQTFKTEVELNPSNLIDSASLGQIMAIKPCLGETQYVLTTYDGGQLFLWDIRSKKILSKMEVEKSPMSIDFDNTHKQGIIGSPCSNLEIFLLSPDNLLLKKTKLVLKNPGTSVVVTRPDSKVFAAGGWDGRTRIYSWKTLKALASLNQHKATVHDIIFSSCMVETYESKCLMAVAGKDGNISLWNLYN